MSTQIDLLMDEDALYDRGPYTSIQTTNLTPSGPVAPEYRRSAFDLTARGRSPQGGISYIDQAEGGVIGPRGDVFAGPLSGIRSYRQRTQPFNGEMILASVPVETRVQGNVGKNNRGSVGQRANSQQATNIPDEGDVVSAFTNPALDRLIRKVRGHG